MMSERRNGGDLVVVGGGVIGLAVAREAAARGLDVLVVERGRLGREASWAAAGMLSPLGEALEPGAFLRFGLASLEEWEGFALALEGETDVRVGYQKGGKARVAFTAGEESRLRRQHDWASEQGFHTRWLDAEEARAAEPALPAEVLGALTIDRDHRVDTRKVTQALARAAHLRGVRVLEDAAVERVLEEGDVVGGVRLVDGRELHSPRVLLAAGAWSGGIAGVPNPVPVRPVRGQLVALRPERALSERVLESEDVYLVPREDGRLVCGATVEDVGFRRDVTAGGLAQVLGAALRLAPELEAARVVETWSGLRPATPDGKPVLGPHPQVEGLHLATGHYRNGILLAPVTASTMASALTGEPAALPPEFAPARFQVVAA